MDRNAHYRAQANTIAAFSSQQDTMLLLFDEQFRLLSCAHSQKIVNGRPFAEEFASDWHYLGHINQSPWFAYQVNQQPASRAIDDDFIWNDLRKSVAILDTDHASAAAYAKAIVYWHRQHRFCGRCGANTVSRKAGHERHCPSCGNTVFPRTDPAIIVAITHGDQLLLARQASWPEKRYSVLAGFVEPGETFEQAIEREVFEESALPVSDFEYLGSQPWPFPCSVMIGFSARAAHQNFSVEQDELEHAMWVSPDSIVKLVNNDELRLPTKHSISYSLIKHWGNQHGIDIDQLALD